MIDIVRNTLKQILVIACVPEKPRGNQSETIGSLLV